MSKDMITKEALRATTKEAKAVAAARNDSELGELMARPAYLRQSSALINDALQKGFDVLQLANGDIVTTGTKTIVYQYSWDESKEKLVKTKSSDSSRKAPRKPRVEIEEDDEEEEVFATE